MIEENDSSKRRLHVEPLRHALSQLEAGLNISQKDLSNELLRDGVIQRFEYSFDLCWKLLQRYLRDIAEIAETELRTKRDLLREGARRGLITDVEAWFGYLEARNRTSHTYSSSAAQAVYEKASPFWKHAIQLLEQLEK